jgi:hypothetical protein
MIDFDLCSMMVLHNEKPSHGGAMSTMSKFQKKYVAKEILSSSKIVEVALILFRKVVIA